MVASIDPRREALRKAQRRNNVATLFGPPATETILASGPPPAAYTGRTYDCKRSTCITDTLLRRGGRPHMGLWVRTASRFQEFPTTPHCGRTRHGPTKFFYAALRDSRIIAAGAR